MRVLHILSSDDQYGSAKSFLELLDRELKTNDVEPYVVIPRQNKIADFCKKNKVKFLAVDYEQFQIPKHDNFFVFLLKYIFHFFNYCKKNKKAKNSLQIIELTLYILILLL